MIRAGGQRLTYPARVHYSCDSTFVSLALQGYSRAHPRSGHASPDTKHRTMRRMVRLSSLGVTSERLASYVAPEKQLNKTAAVAGRTVGLWFEQAQAI